MSSPGALLARRTGRRQCRRLLARGRGAGDASRTRAEEVRGMIKAWALALAMLAGLIAPAAAQQGQQRDPFGGQFGAMEIALPPREAARQAALLGDALAAIQPQRPGTLDVYVVVASFWGDPVFESEASQASDILKEHFNIQGRSILLSAGGPMGERRYPAATPNNLYAALGRVGSLI